MQPITREDRIYAGEDVQTLTRDEYFLKQHVQESQGGSGSSLPAYTSSDIGKVLTVGEGEAVQKVVVPEQTVTLSGTPPVAELTGVDTSFFDTLHDGDAVPFVVDGTTINGTVMIEAPTIVISNLDSTVGIVYLLEDMDGVPAGTYFQSASGGTHTISLVFSNPKAEAKWETDGTEVVYVPIRGSIGSNNGCAYEFYVNDTNVTSVDGAKAIVTGLLGKDVRFGREGLWQQGFFTGVSSVMGVVIVTGGSISAESVGYIEASN